MPSKNYITPISADRRVQVNVCEGEVVVSLQGHIGTGGWVNRNEQINLNAEQARAVAQSIIDGLKYDN
jgi:hypothetical protein